MFRRKSLILFALLFPFALCWAAPAFMRWREVIQADGTSLTLMGVGDESLSYFITQDEIVLVFDLNKKAYCYAYIDDGKLCSTGSLAHDYGHRTSMEKIIASKSPSRRELRELLVRHRIKKRFHNQGLLQDQNRLHNHGLLRDQERLHFEENKVPDKGKMHDWEKMYDHKILHDKANADESVIAYGVGDTKAKYSTGKNIGSQRRIFHVGEKRALVILVEFQDKSFTNRCDENYYKALFNEHGYTDRYGSIGSVSDYYYDQSGGLFKPTFDIVGPVKVSRNYAYYGRNTEDLIDFYVHEMVIEACQLAAEKVNYSDYDWDGDGVCDNVYIVYAGYGEATSLGNTNLIWPHSWTLEEADGKCLSIGDMMINSYSCSNELSSTNYPMGIGTICHEFSHALGLPDFYDTVGNNISEYGMGKFDLMSQGCYNGPSSNGCVPASFTAYEKWLFGWLDPEELYASSSIDGIEPSVLGGKAFTLRNDGCEDEYFLLENRQKISWDRYIPSSGLTFTHVDYDEQAWLLNEVNAGEQLRMLLVPIKDGTNSYYTLPYGRQDSLTDLSSPRIVLHHSNIDGTDKLHKSVYDVNVSSDMTLSFRYVNELLPTKINVRNTEKSLNKYYDMNGMYLGTECPHKIGIYIVRENDRRYKISVK